jgi:hypothetical protein
MRIWDLKVNKLCRMHLLGEHRELHAIWSIITKRKKGYACHPEVLRWQGRLRALYRRHQEQVAEFSRRGWRHHSPLDARRASGSGRPAGLVNTIPEQRAILRRKGCSCCCR